MRLIPVFIPARIFALLSIEVLLIFGSFTLVAYSTLPVDPADYLWDSGLVSIILVAASILVGLYLNNLYSEIYVKSRIVLLQQLCLVIGIAFLMQGMITYADRNLRMSQTDPGPLTAATSYWYRLQATTSGGAADNPGTAVKVTTLP